MDKKDEEIQHKLLELELQVLEESPQQLTTSSPSTELTTAKKDTHQISVKSDLCYFGGIALILTGLFLFFQHIKLGTGILAMFGMGTQGFGLILLPIMVGIGWIMYDSRSRWGWSVLAISCALVIFGVLSNLIMSFPTVSMIGLIMMFFPIAAGIVLLLKGIGGAKEVRNVIEDQLRKNK